MDSPRLVVGKRRQDPARCASRSYLRREQDRLGGSLTAADEGEARQPLPWRAGGFQESNTHSQSDQDRGAEENPTT